jgi:hypothetical protein
LSDVAILYITAAGPTEINWLTLRDAQALGIELALLPPGGLAPEPAPSAAIPLQPPAPLPARPQEPGPTRRADRLNGIARDFAAAYFAHWSESNAEALHYFESVYGERISFADRSIAKTALLAEKRKYAERWPERLYTADPATIRSNCDEETARCTVTGRVRWECRDADRAQRSVGVAEFALQITVVSQAGDIRVDGESSAVISRKR